MNSSARLKVFFAEVGYHDTPAISTPPVSSERGAALWFSGVLLAAGCWEAVPDGLPPPATLLRWWWWNAGAPSPDAYEHPLLGAGPVPCCARRGSCGLAAKAGVRRSHPWQSLVEVA